MAKRLFSLDWSLPLHFCPGIPVAERAPDPHDVPFFHVVEEGGYKTGFIHREGYKPFLCRGGGDADGDLSLSGHGQLGKLAGRVCKLLLICRIQEYKPDGLEISVFSLRDNLIYTNRIG